MVKSDEELISQLHKFNNEAKSTELKRNEFIKKEINLKDRYLVNFGSNKDIEEDRRCITGIKVLQQRITFYDGGMCFLLQGPGFVSNSNSISFYKNLDIVIPFDSMEYELKDWYSFSKEEFMKKFEEEKKRIGEIF